MKKLAVIGLAISLAGCSSMPQIHLHKQVPKPIVIAPVVEPQKPATFKQRWQEFKKKHPVKWTH